MKIKFIKPPLGYKHLNVAAKAQVYFFKPRLSHLNCSSCKNQTTVTMVATDSQHVDMEWNYCCPTFQEIIRNEQKQWIS